MSAPRVCCLVLVALSGACRGDGGHGGENQGVETHAVLLHVLDGAEVMSASLNFEELSFVDGYGDLAWRSLPYPEVFVHRVTDVSN